MVINKLTLRDLGIVNWVIVESYDTSTSCYWIVKDGVVQDRVNTWAQAKKYMKQHRVKAFNYKEQFTGQLRLLGVGGEAI